MDEKRRELHVVFGPPAAGKTTYARRLAGERGACLLDSDGVCEKLVKAGLKLAGMNEDDRDSPAYKTAFREVVYETLYALAEENLPHVSCVIAGPFTSEGGDASWPMRLEQRFGVRPEFHFVWCPPERRRERIIARGETRDLPKLASWEAYVATCRDTPPVFSHRWILTS